MGEGSKRAAGLISEDGARKTDEVLRVKAVSRLRLIDASIMP